MWLLCVLVGIARGSTALRLAIAGGCALLSIVALEGRLWRPQLFRLGLVSALVFVFTALLAGKLPCPAQVVPYYESTGVWGCPWSSTAGRQANMDCMLYNMFQAEVEWTLCIACALDCLLHDECARRSFPHCRQAA